ncbi:serine/threonine-protein phosphatase 7 long form homolog [Gastrolobium bilobum]|uniref:serine/threonine-protein phosphatase 7 long form homolog n=1 Tax=Gastrolobium bilobum TaxID=150636 RepID=UPI002AB0E511|nr:serine/threonine-protein phosphatase 7 long form homolog [Gastrolobium bilobum]
MTITLQDVAAILGLPTDGKVVTGATSMDWRVLCGEVLGHAPLVSEQPYGDVKLAYLDRHYAHWAAVAADPQQVLYFTKAHITRMLGSWLLCDKSGGSIVGCRYIALLAGSFDDIGDWTIQFNGLARFKPQHQLLYRGTLDTLTRDEVVWQPYGDYHFLDIPADERYLWLARTPIICFHHVERCQPDRCLRQFGLDQSIPLRPRKLKGVHDHTL